MSEGESSSFAAPGRLSSPRPSSKGKEKATDEDESVSSNSGSEGSDASDSEDDSDSSTSETSDTESESGDDEEEIKKQMEALIEKAKEAARRKKAEKAAAAALEEVVLQLEKDDEPPIPPLNPGKLPQPYFDIGESSSSTPVVYDPDVERLKQMTAGIVAPAPPVPPPELTKSGKPLTKKERKAMKARTAGPDWFDLPAPSEADLPRMYREVEALRLRNQLDPKRFYKKEEGEGKGVKGLPKYFAIGTIIPEKNPFGAGGGENLARSSRKRTLVDELVDDAEAKRYAKKKFNELQVVHGARGKKTKQAKAKWHKF